MTDSRLAQALLSPDCYPHDTGDIRLLETHISWVVLTGPFAYKVKKPVDFGFLDFSTLEKRRFCCGEEVRLNSRFSEGLYLGVAPITGTPQVPRVGKPADEQEAFEYAVRMRQFDPDALLSRLASEEGLDAAQVKALGRKLAIFHREAAARPGPGQAAFGGPEAVARPVLDNFKQIEPHLGEEQDKRALASLREWSEQRLRELRDAFLARCRAGFVRECHGDLHLGNIARIDGEVTFFDCIEFNPALRWIDTQSELAFLLMDMEEKGMRAEASGVLTAYLEYTGDYAGLEVLDFYKAYRAMVRAKVAMLRLADGELDKEGEDRLRKDYRDYIALAAEYTRPRKVFLALMHGVSGTGKSTAAAKVAATAGAIRVRSDVERKRLFGLAPDQSSPEGRRGEIYSEASSDRTFAALADIARRVLGIGMPAIVDATFIARDRRRPFIELARELSVPLAILDCKVSDTVLLKRLEERERNKGGTSEAGVEVMRRQLEHVEPFINEEREHVIEVDTETLKDAETLADMLGR